MVGHKKRRHSSDSSTKNRLIDEPIDDGEPIEDGEPSKSGEPDKLNPNCYEVWGGVDNVLEANQYLGVFC